MGIASEATLAWAGVHEGCIRFSRSLRSTSAAATQRHQRTILAAGGVRPSQPYGWSVTTSPSDVRSGARLEQPPSVIFPVSMSITTIWNG